MYGTAITPNDVEQICAIIRLVLSNAERLRVQVLEELQENRVCVYGHHDLRRMLPN